MTKRSLHIRETPKTIGVIFERLGTPLQKATGAQQTIYNCELKTFKLFDPKSGFPTHGTSRVHGPTVIASYSYYFRHGFY